MIDGTVIGCPVFVILHLKQFVLANGSKINYNKISTENMFCFIQHVFSQNDKKGMYFK